MTGERLAAVFTKARDEDRLALIAYMVPGHPSPDESDAIFDAIVEGGADVIEIGIPFSDPLAEGPTIQRVSFQALENGTTPAKCMDFARRARHRHPDLPIIFMGYLNPLLAYGMQKFAADAGAARADGIIVVDLPPEEAAETKQTLAEQGLDLIFLVAPTSTDERLEVIGSRASGFIYVVSVAGVTGARRDLSASLPEFLGRVRRCSDLPLAVGFGISRREHVEALEGKAEAVVVGSALLETINSSDPSARPRAVREYVETLNGRRVG